MSNGVLNVAASVAVDCPSTSSSESSDIAIGFVNGLGIVSLPDGVSTTGKSFVANLPVVQLQHIIHRDIELWVFCGGVCDDHKTLLDNLSGH